MTTAPVRVLYVAGCGRSGTTLVNNVLGQVDGVFAAGELRYLWHRGVVADHTCACGEPFSRCRVWSGVMQRVADACGPTDASGIGDRLLRRLRMLRLPFILTRHLLGRPPLHAHADDVALLAVYRAIQRETGARVIVDSSKLPPYALLLDGLPGLDVMVLHLVRDPRATAFSWLRERPLDRAGGRAMMVRHPPWKSALLWQVWNALTLLLWQRAGAAYLRVRYEDFVQQPREMTERICWAADIPSVDLPFVSDHVLRLRATHAVAGNPVRHATGSVQLRADDEWRRAMRARDRRLVTTLTAPLLVSLGYPLRPRGRPVSTAGADSGGGAPCSWS